MDALGGLRMVKRSIFAVVAWVIGLAVAALVLGGDDLKRYGAISGDPVKAAATVTGTDCNNHAMVRYKYAISGTEYAGSESSGDICGLMKSGDQVALYYARNKPEVSGLRAPAATFHNALFRTVIVSLVFPIVVICLFVFVT